VTRFAINQRRYRARMAAGCRSFRVELPEAELVDLLLLARCITLNEADDPAALERGLQEFLHRQLHVIANSEPAPHQLWWPST
jgi:hypothetical protein